MINNAATDYPLLDAFWTMMWLFLWVLWLFLLVRVTLDIFRSDDLGGWAKAGWLIFVIILPYLGVLVYLIARGGSMQAREVMDVSSTATHYSAPPEAASQPTSNADELSKLASLHDRGVLNDEEFAAQKAAVLNSDKAAVLK
jgi:putative oligomerization/nucleic acid binding protein/phospholipase D-like protein